MLIRVRGPDGQATIQADADSSVIEFQQLLASSTGVQPWEQEVKCGFPPRPLGMPDDRSGTTVRCLGLQSGDSLTVNRVAVAERPVGDTDARFPAADTGSFTVAGMSEDEQLARALALSMADPAPSLLPSTSQHHEAGPSPTEVARSAAAAAAAARAPTTEAMQQVAAAHQQERQRRLQQQQQQARPRSPARSHPPPATAATNGHRGVHSLGATSNGSSQGGAPLSVPLPDGTAIVRRIIDSDNSCLFNAVGYVMERSRAKAPALRRLIAQEVEADPYQWNEAVLGKQPSQYWAWIQQPDKWGGAIELSILSKYYGREIAAFDIQTKRVDVYGQDAGYTERAMVIYDGLHYDALAVAASLGAGEALDVTVLPSRGPRCEAAMAGAAQLVAEAHAARQFTDTANFTLRCGVCQLGLKGEKEAVEHAKSTGHTNFSEY